MPITIVGANTWTFTFSKYSNRTTLLMTDNAPLIEKSLQLFTFLGAEIPLKFVYVICLRSKWLEQNVFTPSNKQRSVIHMLWKPLSRHTKKPTHWHVRPAKTQISLGIPPVWSEYSLSVWRKLGFLAIHWAHCEDSDQTGPTYNFVVFVMRRLI